jgi:hypothetical protein
MGGGETARLIFHARRIEIALLKSCFAAGICSRTEIFCRALRFTALSRRDLRLKDCPPFAVNPCALLPKNF